jgi:hypothetical protein
MQGDSLTRVIIKNVSSRVNEIIALGAKKGRDSRGQKKRAKLGMTRNDMAMHTFLGATTIDPEGRAQGAHGHVHVSGGKNNRSWGRTFQ